MRRGWTNARPETCLFCVREMATEVAKEPCGKEERPIMETQTEAENKKFGAGGTPGGIGTFLLGFALACSGAWLLTDQVVVSGDYFASGFMLPIVNHRMNSFGLSLIPFIIGIGFLFFDGK